MVCQRREKEKWVYSKLKDQEVQKLNIQLSYDPAIPLWGTNPDKIIIWYVHPYVHSSIIYNSQDMETNYMSINRGMDKEYMVHKNNGMLFSHKKNEVMPFVAMWKDLEINCVISHNQQWHVCIREKEAVLNPNIIFFCLMLLVP